jgi:hypothetical protein
VFADGWLTENGEYLGRPVDVAQLPDGSLLCPTILPAPSIVFGTRAADVITPGCAPRGRSPFLPTGLASMPSQRRTVRRIANRSPAAGNGRPRGRRRCRRRPPQGAGVSGVPRIGRTFEAAGRAASRGPARALSREVARRVSQGRAQERADDAGGQETSAIRTSPISRPTMARSRSRRSAPT